MNILENIYNSSLVENEKHLRFWEDYLQRLMALDFNVFAEKLKVPALVPIGNRVLFRGVIQHTNEVTVALGADYFTKCSIKQAEVLRQHRIKDATSKVESYKKEREYLENQLAFGKRSTFEGQGQDILEHYSEEDDKLWREKHRENMRAYKQKNKDKESGTEFTDEKLWNRLEELELQEDLNNEQALLNETFENISQNQNPEPFVLDEDEDETNNTPVTQTEYKPEVKSNATVKKKVTFTEIEEDRPSQISSKLDLLQKVLEKQHEIEKQLQELKARETSQSLTENDLITKLDEMEQLDELEDEMYRLEDVIENEDTESDNSVDKDHNDSKNAVTKADAQKKSIMFADEIDSDPKLNTLNITFKHSENVPSTEPYDCDKGIQKPSDVYEACSHYFKETKSILKKSKYGPDNDADYIFTEPMKMENSVILEEDEEGQEEASRTIVVKDVLENVEPNRNIKVEESKAKPTSLFKMKRQQQKKYS